MFFTPLSKKYRYDETNGVNVKFSSYDPAWAYKTFPMFNVNGFQFYDHNMNFLLWLSPDKFLHHYWSNILSATIEGNIKEFTKYIVHYVGKATGQEVWKRLTGHYTLQDILSLERPLVEGTLPTHEITLLLFKIADKLTINILGDDSDSDTFVDNAFGKNYPSDITVSLDAEKALVKLLDPEYNHPSKRFPNYPKSEDGLFQFNYDRFAFQIAEDISLVYNDGEICGSIIENNADIIAIADNTSIEIIKQSEMTK